ncbi:MFS general substrate transporter [Aspergillus costaricaensis CBS 115574]|uniref:MFS general substrate transporter n=1 Tax=Aspergillus costaricaensis CBS 115574 TaxID=1448317 RepID=A0ACD1IBP2_9EURO|nr:MFS general substrate transporter [Aspergillus costaricaensis CBS 115574]RAK87174.1 MFS general substrate transporter [Aspergillus costaricaensis CBS 115574]
MSPDLPCIVFVRSFLHRPDNLDHTEHHVRQETPKQIDEHTHRRKHSADSEKTLTVEDWATSRENPHNWPVAKRVITSLVVYIYTFVVYSGSSMFITAVPLVMQELHLSEQRAMLGLSIYVLGYGVGPLLWGPLSEIPRIGRSVVYFGTFVAFILVTIGAAEVSNYSAFVFLRFMQGLFGSPCLANGGASMHDLYPESQFPYALALWVAAAYCGPALGPLLTNSLVNKISWKWTMWLLACMSGPVCILLFLLPETYAPTIRYRSSAFNTSNNQNNNNTSESDNPLAKLKFYLVKPVQITLQDPAILFANIYTSFIYGTYYTFFDAFPIGYPPVYNVSTTTLSLFYLSVLVGCVLAVAAYFTYLSLPNYLRQHHHSTSPKSTPTRTPPTKHERHLIPAIPATFLVPISLFLYGWTLRPSIHWIVSIIGVTMYASAVFIILQCLSMYIPSIYPEYAASLFAANDFCRSTLAAGAVHFGIPLYKNLGMARGSSVLGGVSGLGVLGLLGIYYFGERLRAKSRFVERLVE